MVDETRRRLIKTVATVGALGAAAVGGKEYWWDRRDDHIDPGGMETAVEDAIQHAYDDTTAFIDTGSVEADVTRETYRDRGDAYRVGVRAELSDDAPLLCGDEHAVTRMLQRDAEKLFEATYDATAARGEPVQHTVFEDHVSRYVFSLYGREGVARLEMDAGEAYRIAEEETGYDGGDVEERNAFTVFYRDRLDISC